MSSADHLVLLVEDDDDMRQDLAYLLQHRGYSVVTAAHGKEALETLETSERPCLIILDLMMPVMDGWTLRSELLADPQLRDIPVVLLSGAADLAEEVDKLEAASFLVKPVNLDNLYQVVDAHCC